MKDCYTPQEREAFDALMKANDLFVQLERQHPNEITDWIGAIHEQQKLFGLRVLRRDYPNEFATYKETSLSDSVKAVRDAFEKSEKDYGQST